MSTNSELLIYQNPAGNILVDVRLEDETVWLTQTHMAKLFGKAPSTINEHIKNIFAEGELVENTVMKKFGNSEFQQRLDPFEDEDGRVVFRFLNRRSFAGWLCGARECVCRRC